MDSRLGFGQKAIIFLQIVSKGHKITLILYPSFTDFLQIKIMIPLDKPQSIHTLSTPIGLKSLDWWL